MTDEQQVSCVYHAYEGEELVATGRLTLERVPEVDDEIVLNGRAHLVRSVSLQAGESLVTLVAT